MKNLGYYNGKFGEVDEIDHEKAGGKAPELLKKIQDEMLREFRDETNQKK